MDIRGSLTIGRTDQANGFVTFDINDTSQLNILDDLTIYGGNAGGAASYTLPLASTPTAGKLSVTGGLNVGTQPQQQGQRDHRLGRRERPGSQPSDAGRCIANRRG